MIDAGRDWYQAGVEPFWNSDANELRELESSKLPRTDRGTAVIMAGMKPGGGSAMLLRLAVCTAMGVKPGAGVALLRAEAREPLLTFSVSILLQNLVYLR